MVNTNETNTFTDVEGYELLTPIRDVKGSDQLRLLGHLEALGIDYDADDDVSIQDLNFATLADFIDVVSEHYAVDQKKFDDFTRGPGGFERALNLAIAYAGELGKDTN